MIKNTENLNYDRSFPSVGEMLITWINEEISYLSITYTSNVKNSAYILGLNMSVAHLSCFTKLISDLDLFDTQNLTEIFQFHSLHYSTKRQENISPGSFSKDYYSITQKTAAGVLDMLQKNDSRF